MSNPSYSRVNWEDSPSTNTPINAENLNKMDKGISDCASAIATKQESTDNNLTTTAKTIRGAINEINADLSVFSFRDNEGQAQYSMDDGSTWVNFKNPVGTLSITANGTYNVADYASARVNVSGGIGFTNYGTITSTTSIPCKVGDYIVIMNHWAGVSVSNASEVWSATQNNTTCKIFKSNSTSVVISESVAYNLYVCKIYAL